jgi:hypothetical protein
MAGDFSKRACPAASIYSKFLLVQGTIALRY